MSDDNNVTGRMVKEDESGHSLGIKMKVKMMMML